MDYFLSPGKHPDPLSGRCAMEWVAYLAGEEHSDKPVCVSQELQRLCIVLNDTLPEDVRQKLRPYLARTIGTAGDGKGYMRLEEAARWCHQIIGGLILSPTPEFRRWAYDITEGLRSGQHREAVDQACRTAERQLDARLRRYPVPPYLRKLVEQTVVDSGLHAVIKATLPDADQHATRLSQLAQRVLSIRVLDAYYAVAGTVRYVWASPSHHMQGRAMDVSVPSSSGPDFADFVKSAMVGMDQKKWLADWGGWLEDPQPSDPYSLDFDEIKFTVSFDAADTLHPEGLNAVRGILDPIKETMQAEVFKLLHRLLPLEIIEMPVVDDWQAVCQVPVAV